MTSGTGARYQEIYDRLYALYGDCICPLRHRDPFQLLVAVMLSAQCRDDRVNQVTEKLFALAPDPASMAELPAATIAEIIRPCGLYRNKSENLKACAAKLIAEFHGEVPHTMEELVTLPGIGRKSANVVLGDSFGIPGFPVDTHVNRLLNRIGMVAVREPEKIEAAVNAAVRPELWSNFSHLLIQHGRRVCHAGKPRCGECALSDLCRKHGVKSWES